MDILDTTSSSVPLSSTSPLSDSFKQPLDATQTAQHLVFVDAAIQNPEGLLSGVKADKVVLLDSDQDGVTQITNVLAQHHDLASIHIFSHGSSGTLQLGNTLLSNATIENYANQLQQWGNTLSEQGDLVD
jgi:hypothetical protein